MPDRRLNLDLPVSFVGGRFELVDSRVRRGAVDFMLRVSDGDVVSPALLQAINAARPTLAKHACTSDGDEPMTLPHLIEHVAIDLIVERRGEGAAEPVAGYTVWLDHRRGLARITLSSVDDGATGEGMLAACSLVAQYIEKR